MQRVRIELRCTQCGFTAREDALHLLRRAGMLKRAGDDVDEHLVLALLGAVGPRLECDNCHRSGLVCQTAEDDEQPDAWPDGNGQSAALRPCKQCGTPIPVERQRLFPENEFCKTCQEQREHSAAEVDEREFCPWCGQVLSHKSTRRRGVTEYIPACPGCGYVG